MPVLTHAVEIVFAFPLDSPLDACLELEELGLNRAQRDFFFASEFFKGFMRARFQALHKKAQKGSDMPPAERLKLVESLEQQFEVVNMGEDAGLKASLQFGKTILTSTSRSATMQYLLQTPGAFDLLDVWSPNNELGSLRVLLPGTLFKNVAPQAVSRAVLVCASEPPCVEERLTNPVVKELIRTWRKFHCLPLPSPAVSAFVVRVFIDLAALRLGIVSRLKSLVDAPEGQALKDISVGLVNILAGSPACKSWNRLEKYDSLALIDKVHKESFLPSEAVSPGKAEAAAQGPAGAALTPPAVPAAATVLAPAIGDVLVLNSKMNKDKYDNKRATVLNVLSNGAVLKVELMEGPVKGEIVKRPAKNFTIPAEKAAPRTLGEDVGDKATGKDDLVLKHFGEAVPNM